MAKRIEQFEDIIGHVNEIRYLQRILAQDSVPDVMTFHGNSGLGKSSLAKLVGIELTTKCNPSLRESYVKSIISNNEDTDSIKLFNMSTIQDKEEEIQRVESEMNVSFTQTGRKVLILDEAHRMSHKAQDSILVNLEHLPKGVYVFLCTTDISALQETLQQRSKATIRLRDLSEVEMRRLIRREIDSRHLTFGVNQEAAISAIMSYANNRPRKALNLLENFEKSSTVSMQDLSVFVDMTDVSAVIELLKYLYGSLTLGMDYVSNLKLDDSFISTLIEVCKVAMGHTSSEVSRQDTLYIKEFMKDRDESYIMRFTAELTGLYPLTRNRAVSVFMKNHISYNRKEKPSTDTEQSKAADLRIIQEVARSNNVISPHKKPERSSLSIQAMLDNAEYIE